MTTDDAGSTNRSTERSVAPDPLADDEMFGPAQWRAAMLSTVQDED